MSIYLVVNSDKSIEYFRNNRPGSFSVHLNKLFHFKENWLVALTEISTTQTFNDYAQFYVYSNICQGSYIDGELVPLLRRVNFDVGEHAKTFLHPYYVPVCKQAFTSISFYINDSKQHLTSLLIKPVTITLHFKQTK